jgi:DNA-binding beta-propeller fold protein YncE
MPSATRRLAAAIALTSATLVAAGCGGGGSATGSGQAKTSRAQLLPQQIVRAPRHVVSAAEPQSNGIIWTLAGSKSSGLYEIDPTSDRVMGSFSVSGAARSVAESSPGILGLALGSKTSGALELFDGRTSKVLKIVPLPAPARYVTLGSDGTTFYVLSGWAHSASVTLVNSQNGRVRGTVAVPADTVSVAPDVPQTDLYVLERNGLISDISISGGAPPSRFSIGRDHGRSLALSPDGNTLYVLKGTPAVANVAVVDVATQSVRRVLPAPSHCVQVLISATGKQLYEVAGTRHYGNIQIFAV